MLENSSRSTKEKTARDVAIIAELHMWVHLGVRDEFITIGVRVNMCKDPLRIKLELILRCFIRFNFSYTMITMNCSCLTGQLMPWCELDDLIECLALNVRNLEIWEFLILACVLEIDWRVLFPMMWSHVLCYSFWIWMCFEIWIVSLLLHETEVFFVKHDRAWWEHARA